MDKAAGFYLIFKTRTLKLLSKDLDISQLAASLYRAKEKGRMLCKPMLRRARTICEPVFQNARESVQPMLQSCYSFPNEASLNCEGWSVEKKQALQQAENLKWQQEMFHRILKMIGLCQEGLIDKAELKLFRLKLLDKVTSLHADGEWANFTRDKLLFLQDLLYARCISEEDYHEAKRPLLLRLAEQGAVIDSNDVLLSCSAQRVTVNRPRPVMTRTCLEEPLTENCETDNPFDTEIVPENIVHYRPRKRSTMQFLSKAMSKFKQRKKSLLDAKVELPAEVAETFERENSRNPEDCPDRDAPVPPSMRYGSPHPPVPACYSSDIFTSIPDIGEYNFFAANYSESLQNDPASPPSSYATLERSNSPAPDEAFTSSPPRASPPSASSASSSKRMKLSNFITDFICKLRGEQPSDTKPSVLKHEDFEDDEELSSGSMQRLGVLRHSKTLHSEGSFNTADGYDHLSIPSDSLPHGPSKQKGYNEVPDIVRWKKRVLAEHSSTNPFTEKIVEDNIKRELQRIRAEMSRRSTIMILTDDQIDAIATRIPIDKAELLRLFPRSWCDNYGDIVLAVVEREYRGHVDQMARLRGAREVDQTCPLKENDEPEGFTDHGATYDNILIEKMWNKISMARCYSAVDENMMQTTILSH